MQRPIDKRIFVAKPSLTGNETAYVNDCLESTWISSAGQYISKFEQSFAKYIGVEHAVSCSNGTVALHVALLALNIGPDDEVIVPTFTYIATANAVAYVGAKRVFIDCDPVTWALNADELEQKITPKTKAIMVVHLYGHPADMDPIVEIAKRHNIHIIEDCAESIGATYKSKMTGTFGTIATFSFFGNKIITCGEGGMVVTNDDALNEKMRLLKGQGVDPDKRYWHTVVGYNYRMTNIQAAIGLAQLEQVDDFLLYRRKLAGGYANELSGLKDYLELPEEKPWAHHCYWMYSVLIKNTDKFDRSKLIKFLDEKYVETRPLFYPIHQMPPHLSKKVFPCAEDISKRGLSLPTHTLMSLDDVVYIAQSLSEFFKG